MLLCVATIAPESLWTTLDSALQILLYHVQYWWSCRAPKFSRACKVVVPVCRHKVQRGFMRKQTSHLWAQKELMLDNTRVQRLRWTLMQCNVQHIKAWDDEWPGNWEIVQRITYWATRARCGLHYHQYEHQQYFWGHLELICSRQAVSIMHGLLCHALKYTQILKYKGNTHDCLYSVFFKWRVTA